MRVPVSSPPHAIPKPTTTTITGPYNYEPTSVLDLCRSPSPGSVPQKPTQDCPELDDHALHNLDWDSIMNDLGFHDDTTTATTAHIFPPVTDFTPFDQAAELTVTGDMYGYNFNYPTLDNHHSNNNNTNVLDSIIEDLIRAADCFDTNQLQPAQMILERLNHRLRSPTGKPLQRAAFHFKDALQSLLSGSNPPRVSSMVEIVHGMRTFKAFSGISPIPMFSIFTTNQALLESLIHSSSCFLHIIDFEIGLGIQYASLMKEIAEKVETGKIGSPVLRITAVVPEEYAVESTLVRENLVQFAQELRIRVQVEFVSLRTFETVSFKAVKFVDGERTAVLLSPAIFRRLGSAAAFMADVRSVSPCVVVFVDEEGWAEAAAEASFRRGVVSSLEFYSMMLESLDASVVSGGGGEWVKRIEMLLLRPKMMAAVDSAGRRMPPWREAFYGAGMRPVQLSQFADFQAECLLAKSQIRGFHVAKRQAELVLFWHERAMVATSAWRC
ncbi:scarecrow-like protein 15 [Lotus japonicus]|uniref:scarecrow-like protein 15 n=1 Tax=Lotus japonicus TaxID=34305 RepID=UPI00258F3A3C|nr:scarecrow-like protein 15 [Lotus japonicus]